MGTRTSHPPGTLSYCELATTDPDAAKAFYGGLLGWTYDDRPIGEGMTYAVVQRDGHAVAGLYAARDDQPAAWLSYVTVESADDAVALAAQLGGIIHQEAFDVFDLGRMAVIADRQGAVFAVWEPRSRIGAELVNDPGAMSLNQLNTDDPDDAAGFYGDLFGWTVQTASEDPPYYGFYLGERLNGGMMPLPEDAAAPPHWLVYFTHESLDEAIGQIADGGGNVLLGPLPIQSGRILVAADPAGVAFALFEGEVDD